MLVVLLGNFQPKGSVMKHLFFYSTAAFFAISLSFAHTAAAQVNTDCQSVCLGGNGDFDSCTRCQQQIRANQMRGA